ncbi:putative kynurenine aminotransferase [Sarocladium strictum]
MPYAFEPRPAKRVAAEKQDVWSMINEAAAKSPVQPIVNMGQGFFGYNPPDFIIEAARDALLRPDCNQYAPTRGKPSLKKAIAANYSERLGRPIDEEKEVTITTGANEGILSALMAFVEQGDEVVVFEPFFDQYISNIEMAGGVVRYVPLQPPANGHAETTSSGDWQLDMGALEATVNNRTKMIIINTPHNPVGKIFTKGELESITQLAVRHNILILSDEVYDSLYYTPMTRTAALSPEVYNLTLTVCSAGKTFYATGWRIGFLIGPAHLIKYVAAAHTRICYTSPSPLQEACAVGFRDAEKHGFWDQSRKSMLGKINRFCEVCDELDLPYSKPEGGYFVMVNFAKVKLPEDYCYAENVKGRPRDFKLAYFLIMELGLAAIPPSEFYTTENQHSVENWLRFAICKEDSVLEDAKDRLRKVKKWMN